MANSDKPVITRIVESNLRTLDLLRRREAARRTVSERIAEAVTSFSGSMTFVWVHSIWFGGWVIVNLGWTPVKPFDPFPFGLLTMIVSLEAIFLSTFVLINQNRYGQAVEDQANLDLQINLLAERELTKILCIVDKIAEHVGVPDAVDDEALAMEESVTISELIEELKHYPRTDGSTR